MVVVLVVEGGRGRWREKEREKKWPLLQVKVEEVTPPSTVRKLVPIVAVYVMILCTKQMANRYFPVLYVRM